MTDDTASNAQLFLSRIRDHYVEQLLLFVAEQRRNSIRGEAEVKLELEPGTRVFRSLSCADFVRNDGEPEIIEFEPERILGFEPITATLGNAELEIENLRWDDVVIDHNGAFDAERILGAWFEKWFDPDDRRYRPGADLGNRGAVTQLHQGAKMYYRTPCRTVKVKCSGPMPAFGARGT